METIKRYFEALSKGATLSEIPYGMKRADYTITFVQPILGTTEGWYKMIVPGMAMNRDNRHIRCIFVGMELFDPGRNVNDFNFRLKRGLLQITDHLVLPFISQDLSEVLEKCRTVNKRIKFSYWVDFNYYHTPDSSRFRESYKGKIAFDKIEKNISLVDRIFCSNRDLGEYLVDNLKSKLEGSGTQVRFHPIFFDKTYKRHVRENKNTRKREKFTVGLIASVDHIADVHFIRGALIEFDKRHKGMSHVVIVDYDGMSGGKNNLKSLNFQYVPRLDPFNYYQGIYDLGIHVLLLPCRDSLYNRTSRNYAKWLEFVNVMGIPVIMSDIPPYNKLVQHGFTGLLCKTTDTWVDEIGNIMLNVERSRHIHYSAGEHALKYDIQNNTKLIEDLYVI